MKGRYFRFFTLTLTFTLGLSAVWFFGHLTYVPREIPIVSAETIDIPKPAKSRFSPYARGCGNIYVQSYETDDGQFVAEGLTGFRSKNLARREFLKTVRSATAIVQRVRDARNHLGKRGERAVLRGKDKETGEGFVEILWYDGDDTVRFISAPSLELALEFEQYLISIDFASPI